MWLVVLLTALAIVTASPTNSSDETGSGSGTPPDTDDEYLPRIASNQLQSALQNWDDSTKRPDEFLGTEWAGAVGDCEKNQECKTKFNEKGTEMEKVASGFEAAQGLSEGFNKVFEKSNTFGKLAGLLDKVAPFLGAAGAIVSIFTTFEDSQEVQRLDKLTTIVNKGFDRMEGRFDQIKVQIENLEVEIRKLHFWSGLQPHLTELKIVKDRMQSYYRAETRHVRQAKRGDLTGDTYTAVHRALKALKFAFNREGGFHTSVCADVIHIVKADNHEALSIMIYLYSVMITGAQHYLMIGNMLNRVDMQNAAEEYTTMLRHVGGLIKDCEVNITTEEWKSHFKKDALECMNHKDFIIGGREVSMAHKIYGRLADKYYWMDWIVAVYPNMEVDVEQVIYINTVVTNILKRTMQYTNWRGKYNVIVTAFSPTLRDSDVSTRDRYFDVYESPTAKYVYDQVIYNQEVLKDFKVAGVLLDKGNHNVILGRSKLIEQRTARVTYHTKRIGGGHTGSTERSTTDTNYKIFYLG